MRHKPRVSLIVIALLPLFCSADTIETFRVSINVDTIQKSEFGETSRSTKTTGCHKIDEVLPISSGDIEVKIHVDALTDRGLEFTIELLDDQGEVARSTSVIVPNQDVARFSLSSDSIKATGRISRRGPHCLPEVDSLSAISQ